MFSLFTTMKYSRALLLNLSILVSGNAVKQAKLWSY